MLRLQKVLQQAGIASRRRAETLITAGLVEVNGQVVTELGTQVNPDKDEVRFKGKRIKLNLVFAYAAVHKPPGHVSTRRDEGERRPLALHLLPPHLRHLNSVGRLDMWSSGLLLYTNDGQLAHRLSHPNWEVEKTYEVTLPHRLTNAEIRDLRKGIMLEDGMAKPVRVIPVRKAESDSVVLITLKEGRNREVRRLMGALGHKVKGLKRVAYGPVELGELQPGGWRPLTEAEVAALKEAVGLGGSDGA